ncbi:MAG: hypothetical protein WCK67_09400 [bacterium]
MKKKVKNSFSKVNKILNQPIKTSDLYIYMLKKAMPLSTTVNNENVLKFSFEIKNEDSIKKEINIKKLNPSYVLIRNKSTEIKTQTNEYKPSANFKTPLIRRIEQGLIKLKWNYVNFSFITAVRTYNLELFAAINNPESENAFKKISCNLKEIDKKHFNLHYKAKIFEEILEMSPYLKSLSVKNISTLPIIKEPLMKSYFSFSDFDKFREALSLQNDTRKSNVEVSKIYDKLYIQLYQNIKPDDEGKNLLCYPSEPVNNNKKSKLYYLITGKRKDNGEPIKALLLQEN